MKPLKARYLVTNKNTSNWFFRVILTSPIFSSKGTDRSKNLGGLLAQV